MHLLPREAHDLAEGETAFDPGQSPARYALLSFTDTDLAVAASAAEARGERGLRLAHLGRLRHPLSVDLLVANTLASARVVVVRLLGGLDYWRYGADELSALARAGGMRLLILPGCDKPDPRLAALSTEDEALLGYAWRCFLDGGRDNAGRVIDLMRHLAGEGPMPGPSEPQPRWRVEPPRRAMAGPLAALVHYRALAMGGDLAPIDAMAAALEAEGLGVARIALASTKEADCAAALAAALGDLRPDVVVNATAFSARADDGASPFDAADCPVIQAIVSNGSEAEWRASRRGVGATDLAINVAMPELDGRLAGRVIGFRAEEARHPWFEWPLRRLAPAPDGIGHLARQAGRLAALRRKPPAERRIAVVLNRYPDAGGRAGHAVGLDGPASLAALVALLCAAGYDVGPGLDRAAAYRLVAALEAERPRLAVIDPEAYAARAMALPEAARTALASAWGEEALSPRAGIPIEGVRIGRLDVLLQPLRAPGEDEKRLYHDAVRPPHPGLLAFGWWLDAAGVDAVVHLGAHGSIEWLPGKAAGLSPACWPQIVLGAMPVVYPFIVSDPGEASAAKRRLGAVTLGHLTPPMIEAGCAAVPAELERLMEEYSQAVDLDPARARRIERLILAEADGAGLLREMPAGEDPVAALDAWLCDIKTLRIKDGLHVLACAADDADDVARACAAGERAGLLAALDGRFVPPGPSGAPSRGRVDVVPTGRNLVALDPRQTPTPTAEALGRQAAEAIVADHLQRHGDWPKRYVVDCWGSASIRTGGEELATALALMGVRLRRDASSDRVNGFEVLTVAEIGRPRTDVTLRISGLYRDIFQSQIELFDLACEAVAARSHEGEDNPLAEALAGLSGPARRLAGLRVFGPAPERYGTGLEALVLGPSGRDVEGEAAAAHHAAAGYGYGAREAAEGVAAGAAFADRLAASDGLLHGLDMEECDILEAPDHALALAGYGAAGGAGRVVLVDRRGGGDRPKLRALDQEIARVIRGRAANPRWIAGMMRHDARGAAEMAQTVDALFAYCALGAAPSDALIDTLHQAYLEDETVAGFLRRANRPAYDAIAARFTELIARGLWRPRRNAPHALGALAGAA